MKTSVFFTSLYDYYTMILFNASSSCFILLFKIISHFSHAGQNLSQSLLEYWVQTLSSVSSVNPFILEILKREMLAYSQCSITIIMKISYLDPSIMFLRLQQFVPKSRTAYLENTISLFLLFSAMLFNSKVSTASVSTYLSAISSKLVVRAI